MENSSSKDNETIVPSEIQNIIDLKIKNSICKIEFNNSKIENGFLCKIPFPDFFNLLPVLITNYYEINKDNASNNIKIVFDNNKKIRYITNIKQRKTYINKEYDILIIEIFPKEDDLNIFLEIDEYIFNNLDFKNKSISILNYSNDPKYGILNNINDYRIEYKCWRKDEVIEGPIILLDSLKVIEINKKLNNYGILLKDIIKEFNRIENDGKKNEINLIIKINEYEINKNIYILNYPYYRENGRECEYEGLKELNKLNTTIFINDKEYEYSKYKTFDKKGEYKIKIKFKILLKDCYCMFLGCKNIIRIDLSRFNSKNVTNISAMFRDCTNLINVNLSNFDTKNVTNMNSLFNNCNSLTNINLSKFDTKNVTDMRCMFKDCNNLTNINLSHFDTKNVINYI